MGKWVILLRDLIDMPSRQHIRLSVKEIERLFERATFDADTLDSLIHELDHRSVHRAKELRQRILAARQALNVEVDLQTESSESSLCRSPTCRRPLPLSVPFCPFCGFTKVVTICPVSGPLIEI